jgi:hypothetical protein
MNTKLIFILVIISLALIFWVGTSFGEEELGNADHFELILTADQQAILDRVTWSYVWDGCWQATTTCAEYKVKMTATVK